MGTIRKTIPPIIKRIDAFPSSAELELNKSATTVIIIVTPKMKPKLSNIRASASIGSGNSFLSILIDHLSRDND
jgi:hypothetical protein